MVTNRQDDLSQSSNRILDHVRPGIAAIDPDKIPKFLFRGKYGAGGNADAGSQRLVINRQRVNAPGQFHPKTHSSRGSRDFCALGKMAANGFAHPLHLSGIKTADLTQMMIVASILQKLSNSHLRERSSRAGIDKFQKLNPLLKSAWRNPANAATRR